MATLPPRTRKPVRRTPAKPVRSKPKESFLNRKISFGGGGGMPAMKETDVLLFTGELADLLEAGMTLGEALGCLANQGEEESAQRAVCKDLTARIVNGESFSDAVGHHPKTFQPLYANMIRAGEASGAMVDVLRHFGYPSDDGIISLYSRINDDHWKMLERGEIHLIGSDCHNMTTRSPKIGEAYELISKKFGEDYLYQMNEYGKSILNKQ
jgi:hypothetical protein